MSDYDPLRDRPRNRSTTANGAVVDAILDRTAAAGTGPEGAEPPRRGTAQASGPTGTGTEPGATVRGAASPTRRAGSPTPGLDASLTDQGRSAADVAPSGCLPGALLGATLSRWIGDRRSRS